MGFFSAIKAGVKSLAGFGQNGSSNVMTVARGVGNWIDEQKFTDQERATYQAKMVDSYQQYFQSTVTENTERSRSRRDIAIYIIKTELFLLLASAGVYKFDTELAEYFYRIATESPLGNLTLGVGAFFFGAHLVRAIREGQKNDK